jgi:hypothetical protein
VGTSGGSEGEGESTVRGGGAVAHERCDNLELVNDLEGDGVEVGEGRVDDVVLYRVEHRRDADLRRERERAGRSSCLSFGSLRIGLTIGRA